MEECKVANPEPVNGIFPPHGIRIFKGIPPPSMPIMFEPKFKTNLEYEAHKPSIWDAAVVKSIARVAVPSG